MTRQDMKLIELLEQARVVVDQAEMATPDIDVDDALKGLAERVLELDEMCRAGMLPTLWGGETPNDGGKVLISTMCHEDGCRATCTFHFPLKDWPDAKCPVCKSSFIELKLIGPWRHERGGPPEGPDGLDEV